MGCGLKGCWSEWPLLKPSGCIIGGLLGRCIALGGDTLLLHYGRLRCANRGNSKWAGRSFPGWGELPFEQLSLRFTTAAVAGLPFGGSKVVWFRTDALQVRNRVSPPKSMRDSVAAIGIGTLVGLAGKGSQGCWPCLGLRGLLGAFGEDCSSPDFCAAKIVEFRSRPIIPASLWPSPASPSLSDRRNDETPKTDVETNGLSKWHSGQKLKGHCPPNCSKRTVPKCSHLAGGNDLGVVADFFAPDTYHQRD